MKRYYGRDAPNVQVKLMWSQGSGGDFGKAMGRPEGMGGGVRGSSHSIFPCQNLCSSTPILGPRYYITSAVLRT